MTFIECGVPRMQRNLQTLEQTFQEQTLTSKTGAHPVQPREGSLTVLIRKREVLDVDLQLLPPPVGLPYGVSQFVHPPSHQSAFEFQNNLVASGGGDSQHTKERASAVP
jgi:hypothetical protein